MTRCTHSDNFQPSYPLSSFPTVSLIHSLWETVDVITVCDVPLEFYLSFLRIESSGPKPLSNSRGLFGIWSAAAAAAKSLQSCLTLCDPIEDSPQGSTVPGILQVFDLKPFNYIGITDQFLYHLKSLSTCLKVVNCSMALKSFYIIRQPTGTHHEITSSIHRRSSLWDIQRLCF